MLFIIVESRVERLQDKKYVIIWIALPVLFGLVYQYVRFDYLYLSILAKVMMLYVLFFSVLVHELSHGLAASACGDDTARSAHRLTLNPIRHVSLVGTIIVPAALYFLKFPFILGWAKGVPFNPVNFRRYPRDMIFIAIAGPLSNVILCILCFGLYLIFGTLYNGWYPENAIYFDFNLLSVMDLDWTPYQPFWFVVFNLLAWGVLFNLALGVFNLLPFPPLDGSWLLKLLLPRKAALYYVKAQNYGMVVLIIALNLGLLGVFFIPVMVAFFLLKSIADFILLG